MNTLTNTGRIIFSLPFVIFGLFHFINGGQMAGMVPGFIPGGIFWVYVTGLAMIAAAVSFFTGRYARLAGILLAVLLGIFVLTIHLPGLLGGNQMSMPGLLKDFALAGGALVVAGLYDEESSGS